MNQEEASANEPHEVKFCDKHGIRFFSHAGCPKCGLEKINEDRAKQTQDSGIRESDPSHGGSLVPEQYSNQ